MNECEMQIQLRQPPPSPAQLPSSTSQAPAVHHHHRSRLETQLNLHKPKQSHVLDLKAKTPPAAAEAEAEDDRLPANPRPVSVATVQSLLESFDHRIRQTKCLNMDQAKTAGIPSPGATKASAPPREPSPTTANSSSNSASAAALMLLKNRIIPPVAATHQNGIDLSKLGEQSANGKPQNGTHIPLPTSPPGSAPLHNNHSSPSSSSGSSDCNSPPSNGAGNGGSGAGAGGALNGSAGKATNGGRLQFFKDGKFILELASSREQDNGRPGWVAVPRKIYWPPTAQGFTSYNAASTTPSSISSGQTTAGAIPHALGTNTNSNHSFQKNESSASLSFSDDNSSIQSSPWQREHCWKQLNPRKNVSREMCFVYRRPRKCVELTDRGHAVSLRGRRRPYSGGGCGLAIKDAFQRISVSVLKASEAEEVKSGAGQVTLMETDESKSEEKTDLGKEKQESEQVGEEQVKQRTEQVLSAKNGDESERMDEDQVDGRDKTTVESDAKTENSNSNDIDSNKTVKQELVVDQVQTSSDDAVKVKQEQSSGDGLNSTKDTRDDEADKENKKEVRNGHGSISNGRRVPRKRQDLEKIISNLLTNRKTRLATVKMSSPKLDSLMHSHMHQHVSPRKRILREFERVSLDEVNSNAPTGSSPGSAGKRHRSRGHHHHNGNGMGKSGSSSSTFFVPSSGLTMGAPHSNGNGLSGSGSSGSKLAPNGNGAARTPANPLPAVQPASNVAPASSKPISSYSIISLLGHNSSGGGDRSAQEPTHYASSQQQHMESVAASKGMDLQQYNKSLPPKKKLSPPPPPTAATTNSNHSWSSPKATDSPLSGHLLMRSPEMSPSPEHGGRLGSGFKAHYSSASSAGGSSAASFHPYLNVSHRASPSDDAASLNGSRYAHHHRSSPQFARDRHLSGSSPTSRYSPGQTSSGNGKNPPAAHGAASPYSSSSRPSPMSGTSPLSSHYFPASSAAATATSQSKSAGHRRSPSPAAQRRLIEDDRETEQNALAMQQLELERYAKFYGHGGMLGPGAPPPPHLMMPGFEHLSEAAAAAHLMRTGATPSAAALMNSLHQTAYLMYPPSAAAGANGGPSNPYMPPSSNAYYNQYLAAAAAAMYGRGGSPLWPYMSGGIPGPPGSPLRLPTSSAPTLHHSPQMVGQRSSPVASLVGREEGRTSAWVERRSPSSPLAMRPSDRARETAARESAVAMDQRDDPDVPLNLSKH